MGGFSSKPFIGWVLVISVLSVGVWAVAQSDRGPNKKEKHRNEEQTIRNATKMLKEGRQTFRHDTFGDEAFWSGVLQLHDAIQGAEFGGVGPGVSPKQALDLGLKVDLKALPKKLVGDLKKDNVDLSDPAVTLQLLKLDAVVGVKGTFNTDGSSQAVGLTCAVCYSTVNDKLAPGIRRGGGWGTTTYWNALVAVLELRGIGTFFDERLDDFDKYPIAATMRFGHISVPPEQDQVTSKLPALHFYQLALPAPKPTPGEDFNPDAATRGGRLFIEKADCNSCHTLPLLTEPGWNDHTPEEMRIDDF